MLGFLNRANSTDTSNLKSKPLAATNGPQLNRPVSSQKSDFLNGLTSPRASGRPVTPSRTVSGMSTSKRLTKVFSSIAGRLGGSQIKEEHATVRQRSQRELGSHVEAFAFDTSFGGLLEWIRTERLTRVPHKGGQWDRVLIQVQHFAEQIHHLSSAIDQFADDCTAAAHLMYGHCLLLLELGHENASALEKAFHLFYQFGLELLPLLRCESLFTASSTISDSVSSVFSDLLNIVTAVAINFYRAVHSGRESTTIDVYRAFGSQIEVYHSHILRTTYAIWGFYLNGDDDINRARLETIQRHLSPQDKILSFLAAKRINIASQPEQFTCTWFQSHLISFIRSEKRILLVEGKTGSGKTTLANWTLDRLQRNINKKSLTTISFFFNPNIDSLDSSLELVKTLLQQLLFQRIGDVDLFNALNDVLTESMLLQSAEEQETRLWAAMFKALQNLNESDDDSLVIIIDGLDVIQGQEAPAQKASQKLYDLVQKISSIRLIQFTQPQKVHPKNSMEVDLTPEILQNDMSTIVRRKLVLHPHFKSLNELEQEKFVDQLVQAAGTSILWLSLACKFILQQHQAFEKSLEVMLSSARNIADTVHKMVASSHLDQDAKSTLSYVLTARRPLLFDEVQLLLQAQPDRFSMIPRSTDLDAITKVIGPFVLRTEGLLGVRHNSIKLALVAEQSTSKWLIQAQERHKDLLMRVLTYANTRLVEDRQASLEPLETRHIDGKLRGHTLLEYAIRYWSIHFQRTIHYKPSGPLTLPKDFKSIFPSSVIFSLLEEGCWLEQLTPLEVIPLLVTAYRVRETMYGPDKACVLQTALAIARIYDGTLSRTSDAVEWYFKAMKICYKVLGAHVEMTVILCQTILRLSEKLVVAKRSSIMEWREEVMITLITIYTQRFGAHSKEVIEIRETLIELYIYIKEEHRCEEHRKLIEIAIGGGRGGISFEGNLGLEGSMTLKKRREQEGFDGFEEGFLGGYVAEGKAIVLTFEMIQQILIRITLHIKAGHFEKAEELYIELWLKLTEYCQIHREVEWHAKKLEIMIAYSRFLHTHHRSSEASSILLCIWREYEHHEVSSFELINILLKEVAVFMKVFGLFTTSLAVFKKCWSYFKYAHKEHTSIFKEIETSITIISTEIVKTSTTSTTSETIIREVFESSLSSSETITTTTIELCRSLTSTYIKKERYSEAIICIESALRRSWASFFFESDVSITISTEFTSENIELVMKLAQCYLHQKRYEKVEEIYIRLYRVYRRIHTVKHQLVITYIEKILAFYREHGFFTKAISFYQELLVDYRIVYGAAEMITIDILYNLGDLCRQHYLTHGYWIEYYLEIVTVLNKGRLVCHEKALRALIIVAEHHYEALRYSEALVYFRLIFSTFKECGLTYKYFEQTVEVQRLIEHYFRTIEESQIDIEIHIKMIKELRETCLKYYGEVHIIVRNISLSLATVCLRSEKYEFEAIALYEHIVKTSTTVTKEVKSSLRQLYYKRTTKSTTTVTKEEIEKTITMTYEHYTYIKEEYTCIHEETLSILKELIVLWHKLSKSELIIKELRSVMIEIITTVKKSEVFVETGKFLAEIFIFCGLQSFAYEFVHELRRQIIYKVISIKEINVIKVDRACLAFIAAFEYYVRADWSVTLSVLMADLIAEYSYYWRFCESIKAHASMEVVFVQGGRLRHILARTNRLVDFVIVEDKLIEYFIGQEKAVMTHCQQFSVKLFIVLLLKYCSTHQLSKTFTATAGHAAISEITALLKVNKQKEATELARCTFYYLMAHEGLDDPTEITMGFRLALLMGGRVVKQKPTSTMLELSRNILKEVFVICTNFKINVARISLSELNELIEMIGEQKDYSRLHWLLRLLWTSRESQTKWPKDAVVKLGMRLVQAEFAAGHTTSAVRLCEDIVYNIRRVHGARHQNTLSICELLASLYTSIGMKHKSGSDKRDQELAKFYFKKALTVQEDALKAFIGWDENDQDDDDDDLYTEYTGSVVQGHESKHGIGYVTFGSEREEIDAATRHLRKLRLAMQRFGGWTKSASEFEKLTETIWKTYGNDLKLKEDEVRASYWKPEKLSDEARFDCFDVPHSWSVVAVPVAA